MNLRSGEMSRAIERDIRRAAVQSLQIPARHLQSDYEHGQWWVTDQRTGAQWSAEDACGPGSVGGFTFEQVTQGD